MSIELRILSGLHRGACVPVSADEVLSLGADDSCDVMLVDPEWSQQVWHLVCTPRDWLLQPSGDAESPGRPHLLGEVADFNGLRMTVCEHDAPWRFQVSDGTSGAAADPASAAIEDAASAACSDSDTGGASVRSGGPAEAASTTSQQPFEDGALASTRAAVLRRGASRMKRWPWRLRLVALGSLALASYSVSLAIIPPKHGGLTPRSPSVDGPGAEARDSLASGGGPDHAASTAVERAASAPGVLTAAVAASSASATAPALQELKLKFTARLKAAELWTLVDAELGDSQWILAGNLGPDDERRLGRVIAAFSQEHAPLVDIRVSVKSAEELLPFRIQEVSGGATASVVTSEGRRLYVGDSHAGYTLAKVGARSVTFTGKRKIEVPL